jgi:hypothetical protein
MKFEDHKEEIQAEEYRAGISEVYRVASLRELGHLHTDYIGEYIGGELSDIPDDAEVYYTVLDAEEYEETILANTSGKAEDFVCDETGLVLIVQYYEEEAKNIIYDRIQVINIPHQMPVRIWECESFSDAASESINICRYGNMQEAKEMFGDEIPDQIKKIINSGETAVEVVEMNSDYIEYFAGSEFDEEEFCERYLAMDLHGMIVIRNEEEAAKVAEHYTGHQEIKVRAAAREIIELQRILME